MIASGEQRRYCGPIRCPMTPPRPVPTAKTSRPVPHTPRTTLKGIGSEVVTIAPSTPSIERKTPSKPDAIYGRSSVEGNQTAVSCVRVGNAALPAYCVGDGHSKTKAFVWVAAAADSACDPFGGRGERAQTGGGVIWILLRTVANWKATNMIWEC